MIVVEFDDDQYGDLMKDVECFEEVAEKAKKIVKKITHAIGDNSMSMRGRQYPQEQDYYAERSGRGRSRSMGMRGFDDDEPMKYDRRYM